MEFLDDEDDNEGIGEYSECAIDEFAGALVGRLYDISVDG